MATESLILRVLSPEGVVLEKENLVAINLSLAGDLPLGIRPKHAPLLGETQKGFITYRSLEDEGKVELHAGILEIRNNIVIILTSGKVSEMPTKVDQPAETNYNRLMQTLVKQINQKEEYQPIKVL